MNKQLHKPQTGFTIVELMIATVVFSVLLLIITSGVLQFTRQYYKGVISSNTQNTTRAVMDDVVRALQFSKAGYVPLPALDPAQPAGTNGYCIGDSKRYSFKLNAQVTANSPNAANHQSRRALVSVPDTTCTSTSTPLNVTAAAIPAGGRELLGDGMRLVNLSISNLNGATDTYVVTVRVLYGDDDLVCDPDLPATNNGGCQSGTFPLTAIDNDADRDLQCKSTTGSQFCAVSELKTVVKKRIR